jgi:parallel beta-helix repeat protein
MSFGACDFLAGPDEPVSGGNLVISFGESGRSIGPGEKLPGDVLAALRYELTLTGPDGETLSRTVSGGETLSLTVSLGQWRIAAKAYQQNILAGTGSQTFTVAPGSNSVRVPMNMAGPCYEITIPEGLRRAGVSSNFSAAFAGTEITLSIAPAPGYFWEAGTFKLDGIGITNPHTFTMGTADVTVSADFIQFIRYVKAGGTGDGTSWEDASGDLQEMMDKLAAIPSSDYTGIRIVKVAAGTYKPLYEPMVPSLPAGPYGYDTPGDNRDKAFILRQGVQVWGGYPASGGDDSSRNITANLTTLSGDFMGNDFLAGGIANNSENAYHVIVGVDIPADSGTVLDGLTITGSNATGSGSLTVNGKNIDRNEGGGMYNSSSSPVLTHVTISGNSAGANGGGMVNSSSSPVLTNVTILNNTSSAAGGGIYNLNSSPVLNDVMISGNSAGANGGGMYNSSSSPELTNVTISGNSAGNGGGGMYNNSSSPVLGNVTISNNTVSSGNGGGIYNNGSSSPVLTGGTISGNTASASGAGMYNNGSSPALTGVTISGNTASASGGGMYNESSSSPVLTDVTISGNNGGSNGGGAMFNNSSSPVLTNVTISGNTAGGSGGGGMYNNSSSSPVLTNVTISGNTAGGNGGGMNNDNSSPVLINVRIAGNSTTGNSGSQGGGIYSYNSSPALINVTIAGNKASSEGGGMWNGGTNLPQIRNSIIWGNTAGTYPGIRNNSGTPVITYSIVQDSTDANTGNIVPAPAASPFVDWKDPSAGGWTATTGGDYHLNGSVGVDAGNDGFYPANAADTSVFPSGLSDAAKAAINAALEKDLGGNIRKNSTIDMGAFEN